MRFFLKLALVVGVVAVVAGVVNREKLGRLMAVNSLFEPDRIVANFSNMDRAFEHREVPRGDGQVSQVPNGPAYVPEADVVAWLQDRSATAFVVLKDGALVHESYYQGTGAEDLRISWSMAKSYLSALFGILLEEGVVDRLDDPVTKYAPELGRGAYADVSIRDVLTMQSGIAFNEDYLDFYSDINRMGRVLALGGSMDEFAAGQDARRAAAGEAWKYVSIDTHVIGMVLRGATGRSATDLLSDHIIAPMGLEAAPYYVTDGFGVAFVLGGLNLRTRDYARMGQMFLQNGRWNGVQIVPEDWAIQSTQAQAKTAPGARQYGYQWWIPGDSSGDVEFYAQGIYGQYVYVNRVHNVVIALNAADRRFREAGREDADIMMMRRIAQGL